MNRKLYLLLGFVMIFAVCGCGLNKMGKDYCSPTVESNGSMLDESLVEGQNRIVFAITPNDRERYIPKTAWREKEKLVSSEVCSLKLVKAKEGMNEQEINRFLSGKSSSLRMRADDFFLVELNGAHWISEVCVEHESGGVDVAVTTKTMGTHKVMVDDEFCFKDYAVIHFPGSGSIPLDDRLLGTYLLVTATDDTRLCSFVIKGKPTLGEQIIRDKTQNKIVLDANAPENPWHIYRFPITAAYYTLADRLLEKAGCLSEHQKIMVFMDYIADYYYGVTDKNSCLEDYIGLCGYFSNLLAALACTQGIPARIVTLANYPHNTGHVVCEVFYDGEWHLYDPTFGAYYTISPDDTVYPAVLGFDSLVQGDGNSPDVVCIVTSPHRLISKLSYGFLGPRIYEEANPKGPIGTEHQLVYPLEMEMSADGNQLLVQKDFSTKYQGISYIGAASMNNIHEWLLDGLEPGKQYEFIMTATGIGGEIPKESFVTRAASKDIEIMEGAEHVFTNEDKSSLVWKICFVSESSEARIILTHDYRGPELHYVLCSSFELKCVN